MQIQERDFQDAIAATKKDAKLVAAAKNERTNAPEGMYREFEKLTPDRQREIIIAVSMDFIVGAQWKVAFPLNQLPAEALPDAVRAVGKALFFTRDEDSVKETVRAVRLFEKSAHFRLIAGLLGEAAEIAGPRLASVSKITTYPEIYGLIQTMQPSPASERIIHTILRIATYTASQDATDRAVQFLYARRFSPHLDSICSLLENSVFMARDPRSVRAILDGLTAGSIDAVLQRHGDNHKQVLSTVRDIAWKTRDPRMISSHLQSYLR